MPIGTINRMHSMGPMPKFNMQNLYLPPGMINRGNAMGRRRLMNLDEMDDIYQLQNLQQDLQLMNLLEMVQDGVKVNLPVTQPLNTGFDTHFETTSSSFDSSSSGSSSSSSSSSGSGSTSTTTTTSTSSDGSDAPVGVDKDGVKKTSSGSVFFKSAMQMAAVLGVLIASQ